MADANPLAPYFRALQAGAAVLDMRPREATVMRDCLWARTQVANGHFLVSPGNVPSAQRLIDRGFLTRAPNQLSPPMGLVVVLTQENWASFIEAAGKAVPVPDGAADNG